MMVLVTIIHILACVTLVLVVLLQAGKGADMGAVFGGASSTIFGSSGAGNFLTRLTTGAAVVFMITSLTLTYGSTRQATSTIMPEAAAPPVDLGGGTGGEARGGTDTAAVEVDTGQAPPAADAGTTGDAATSGEAAGGTEAAPAGAEAPAEPAAP